MPIVPRRGFPSRAGSRSWVRRSSAAPGTENPAAAPTHPGAAREAAHRSRVVQEVGPTDPVRRTGAAPNRVAAGVRTSSRCPPGELREPPAENLDRPKHERAWKRRSDRKRTRYRRKPPNYEGNQPPRISRISRAVSLGVL